MAKVGRPTIYTPELGDRICDELTNGKSLVKICEPDDMPATVSIYKWLREHEEFANNYTRARENQADKYADEIVEIADRATDKDSAAAMKVRVDARKWVSSKLKPKKYGDKLDLDQTIDGKITIQTLDYRKYIDANNNDSA
jgi:hypothetical protein